MAELLSYKKRGVYKEIEALYCSPLQRTLETGSLLYPGYQQVIIAELRECDFGVFENKNHEELSLDQEYLDWLNNNNINDRFPGGESIPAFKERSYQGYLKVIDSAIINKENRIAIIVHGGTIMTIMERLSQITDSFYQWKTENGLGFELEVDEEHSGQEKPLLRYKRME